MRIILAAALATLLAQAPQPQQSAPASIEGQVVKVGTGEPLAGVTIELVRAQGPALQGALQLGPPSVPPLAAPLPAFKTEADGKFRLQNVPHGEYRLYSTHSNSYTPAEYGQRSPSGLGMPLVLTTGQAKTGILLKITAHPSNGLRGNPSLKTPSAACGRNQS